MNGDIVLVVDDNCQRNHWSMARVTAVHPDGKGFVRSVHIKTASSELERPVSKLVLLLEKAGMTKWMFPSRSQINFINC